MSLDQLTQVFREFGGEKKARGIAESIIKQREKDPSQLNFVSSLVRIISLHKPQRTGKLHPATKVFQALRIAVNDELSNIERALPQALEVIEPQGRIVTIAFHEGEDRLVKNYFSAWEESGKGTMLLKKPQTPSDQEVVNNPRSRSAKMRVFERKQE
jgi:16S rRNA (cytosine1402-N4)-methyltransferase